MMELGFQQDFPKTLSLTVAQAYMFLNSYCSTTLLIAVSIFYDYFHCTAA